MSKEFFSEIFRLFAEYEHDLTIYCHSDKTHDWECDIPDKKKLSDSDKQLLKHIVKVLGTNYNSKLAKLYTAFEKFVETGDGTIKIKMPDGVVEMVPIKTLIGGGFFDSLMGPKKQKTRTVEQQIAHQQRKADRSKSTSKKLAHNIVKFGKKASKHLDTAIQTAQDISSSVGLDQQDDGQPRKKTSLTNLFGSAKLVQKVQKIIDNIDMLTHIDSANVKELLAQKPIPALIEGINQPTLKQLEIMNDKLSQIITILQSSS